jgi:alcohol dehydrogenase class IV
MAETKKTTITVDDVDYVYEDMTQQQQAMVNHISDLDRKIGTSQFNLDQLNVGKDAFVKMLKAALEPKESE